MCLWIRRATPAAKVSVLFSEPKIPQSPTRRWAALRVFKVSVLFSEPKIPQCFWREAPARNAVGFSALQRAENSSIHIICIKYRHRYLGFSALQRAENSSISTILSVGACWCVFQCSSASRKFLNPAHLDRKSNRMPRFSALQRAENSSMSMRGCGDADTTRFQCSSASRKFLN